MQGRALERKELRDPIPSEYRLHRVKLARRGTGRSVRGEPGDPSAHTDGGIGALPPAEGSILGHHTAHSLETPESSHRSNGTTLSLD